ncbi:hypothetical protein C5O10_03390 [Akkermansia muciniphila]|nr:hypothetical protein C5O09_03360 [Akkermansia muciniphila]QHV15936.1 hypothetical protein C5O10_03390 [Akkermansia muciniphila]
MFYIYMSIRTKCVIFCIKNPRHFLQLQQLQMRIFIMNMMRSLGISIWKRRLDVEMVKEKLFK